MYSFTTCTMEASGPSVLLGHGTEGGHIGGTLEGRYRQTYNHSRHQDGTIIMNILFVNFFFFNIHDFEFFDFIN